MAKIPKLVLAIWGFTENGATQSDNSGIKAGAMGQTSGNLKSVEFYLVR